MLEDIILPLVTAVRTSDISVETVSQLCAITVLSVLIVHKM
jgi:hypothetical protein